MTLEKGEIVRSQGELYRIVGDYSQIESPLDYELENMNNNNDCFAVSNEQAKQNLRSEKWEIVNLDLSQIKEGLGDNLI